MSIDHSQIITWFGYCIIVLCLVEAYTGIHRGRGGRTNIEKKPLIFALLGGLQLAVGVGLSIDHIWIANLNPESLILVFVSVILSSILFMYGFGRLFLMFRQSTRM